MSAGTDEQTSPEFEPHTRRRTVGRELALRLIYMLDMRGRHDTDDEIDRVFELEGDKPDAELFARELYRGVADTVEKLDALIAGTADNWELARMAYIDRALLRLGAYELLYRGDIPPKVTISEAIELAKRYSTEKSSSFVNGILDKIYQTHCADKH